MHDDQKWRDISDRIIVAVLASPLPDRLRVFQEQLSLLPDDSRRLVEHFVSIAILLNSADTGVDMAKNKNFHISLISFIALIATVFFVFGGIYLVYISDDFALSKINILGATIETESVGVACLGFGALSFIFTVRSAINKL